MATRELVRIGTLAERSGVPVPTIKHYLREGLLPAPAKRTARNMAYYDARLVERVRTIKELQKEHFLPLGVIKKILAGSRSVDDRTTAEAIATTLQRAAPKETRSRAQLLAAGVRESDLDWLTTLGLLAPAGDGATASYSGDDLELLRTLGAARRAGIQPEMLPTEILSDYVLAIRTLVRAELALYRAGVVPRAGADLTKLTEVATTLSERLVVLIRRRLLLPILGELAEEESSPKRARQKSSKRRT